MLTPLSFSPSAGSGTYVYVYIHMHGYLAAHAHTPPLLSHAGYLVGGGVSLGMIRNEFKDLHVCKGPSDVGCLIGWDTVPETFPSRRRQWMRGPRPYYSAKAKGYVTVSIVSIALRCSINYHSHSLHHYGMNGASTTSYPSHCVHH
jgi:hypothetical protein